MLKPINLILIASVILLSCHSHSNSSADNSENSRDIQKHDSVAQQNFCYLKVFDTNGYQDSMRLTLKIKGDSAWGRYKWVLPGKDGKSGSINGHLTDAIINGTYTYMQEGGSYTDAVKIIFTRQQAIIIQKPGGQYPLTDTLPAVGCN